MIGLFKQKTPANLIALLFMGILLKMPAILGAHAPVVSNADGILYKALLKLLEPGAASFTPLYSLLAFILLFSKAAGLTNFINHHRMMSRPNYLPGMAYMLITSLRPEWNYFSAPLLINSILILVLSGLFSIYNKKQAKGAVFNIGLALGIASFLLIPSLAFVIWLLLGLVIIRPFNIKEWLICILGATAPFYFFGVYAVLSDTGSWRDLVPHFGFGLPSFEQSMWLAGSFFFLTLPFLTGGYFVQDNLRRMLIQARKGWGVLLFCLAAALVIPFLMNSRGFEIWLLIVIPIAAFHGATYLYAGWRLLPLLLFWLSVAFIIFYQYYGPGW